MNCERVQERLDALADGELGAWVVWRITRHLARCPGCAAAWTETKRLGAQVRSWRAVQAPEILRRRLAVALAGEERGTDRRLTPAGTRILRPAFLTAAGLAATAVIGALLVEWRIHPTVVNAPVTTVAAARGTEMISPTEHRVGPLAPRPAPSRLTAPHPWSPRGTRQSGVPMPRAMGRKNLPSATASSSDRPPVPPGSGDDLERLNAGSIADARPFAPEPAPPPMPSRPGLQEREPGSRVVDDLLYLNPVRVAAADDTGLSAAATALAGGAPAVDERLRQKVVVHASSEKLSDVLAGLSRATGVAMLARMEVADEWVSLWAENRPLIDVMRDLRHLHGYFWSRSKRDGQYLYSLWQDAQSRAQEEAEVQRLAMEQQREFEKNSWQHVKALTASEEERKRLAQKDPYLIAQMMHPVVRAGYQLFAALSPDQQAQLTRGQTPSRYLGGGGVLEMFPVRPYQFSAPAAPAGIWGIYPERNSEMAPTGDVVTLRWPEMTPAQRAAVTAIFRGAASQFEREADHQRADDPKMRYFEDAKRERARLAAAAQPETATISIFRSGEPNVQGMSVRVDFQNGGSDWWIYSNIAVSPSMQRFYSDMLRRGVFSGWLGAQEEVDRCLGPGRKREEAMPAASSGPARPTGKPDPILDRPISVTWRMPLRGRSYLWSGPEVLAALSQAIRHPLVLDGYGERLEQPKGGQAEFRWEKRPLRALLDRLFPGWRVHTDGGAIFLNSPYRLRERLNQVPRAVEEFLKAGNGPLTLDELALLARSLSPWQVVKLDHYLRPVAIDQLLAVQELLKLYGELAPSQREALARGIAYSALTPTQQALFLGFAQRQRPFVEPWRFQQGTLRMSVQPAPAREPGSTEPVAASQVLFDVRFRDEDIQPFALGLFDRYEQIWDRPLTELVGQPFPFPTRSEWFGNVDSGVWEPTLADPRLRKKPLVVVIAYPYAEPYVGTQPPPTPVVWSRRLAERLRSEGVTVVHVTRSARDTRPGVPPEARPSNFVHLFEPGGAGGEVLDISAIHRTIKESPTVFVVGGDEIIRAVFEGQKAWDAAAIERAARVAAGKETVADGR